MLIDLTLTLKPGMRGVDWEPAKTLEDDGWNARTLHLYSHSGTHMDAPHHFGCAEKFIDETPLETCLTRAHIVRYRDTKPDQLLEAPDLDIQPGESLLLHTGWSTHVDDDEIYRLKLPRVSEVFAHWCVEKKIAILGVEPPSVADVTNLSEVTKIHEILLGGGVTIVEGLTNLDQLPDGPVLFGAMPLKVLGGDGAPCRAWASTETISLD
ncbi:cyclase family protein [Akkermansiaceae bacterium]|nr:cyclase family protein [Akkermansiaceae bacterium]